MIDKLLVECLNRKQALERSVFESPPADMVDFNRRLGRWLELLETQGWIEKVLKALDEEEDEQ